jgi:16S rRNA (adenine1518-N6/adenine1519-N6)-dimethyltransferase
MRRRSRPSPKRTGGGGLREPGGSPSTDALTKKELGQHFLVDENILGVIGRLADLHEEDVVLEIGPGLGVLTTYLADRVRQVYTVEVDTSLGPRLTERLAGRPNVELRFGDALRLDLAEAAPGAKKLVANLPYNIATPLIVESLDRLHELELWCVMVQREVADRLFAEPSTKAYGAVSVLMQLVTERSGFHPVSRTVFRPRPNVDSALVAFRRKGLPPDFLRIKAVVEAAFAHRRKRLANSLELAGHTDRARAEEAIAQIGKPLMVRAEELAPAEFLELAEALA